LRRATAAALRSVSDNRFGAGAGGAGECEACFAFGFDRPRARITVEPRSFLDAGTEVLPGERKFTDYALPAGSYSMPLSVVQSTGGRVGWHQSPLPGPFDLPSRYNPYGW